MYKAPLYQALKALSDKSPLRFSMPGHGGKESPCIPSLFDATLDFTELQGTGNLYEKDTVIAKAESLWAARMGAANALFLTGGSSQGVRSALLLAELIGKKVLFGRNTHLSADTAMALCDIAPIYLQEVSEITVRDAFVAHPDIAALFVTSPSYYGVDLKIDALAKLCKQQGIPLIVDEAHGAHYAFLEGKSSAVKQGASMGITSLHKTLPAMGQCALMTLAEGISLAAARRASAAFGTSSPSYVMMAQADMLRAALEKDGAKNAQALTLLRQKLRPFGLVPNDDPYRLHIETAPFGYSGHTARDFLHEQGILIELADKNGIVCILSFYHTEKDFRRFFAALSALYSETRPPLPLQQMQLTVPPTQVLSPREVFFAKKSTCPLRYASGCIAGQSIALFPPCTSLVAPGELLTDEVVAALLTWFPPEEPVLVCVV